MNKFTLNCPIDFKPMITRNMVAEGLDLDRWEDYTVEELIPFLAYEGFYSAPVYTKDTLLEWVENSDEEEIDILSSCLEPVCNPDYEVKWSDVPGAREVRLLLYGRNDPHRRIKELNREAGEMEWLLQLFDKNGIEYAEQSDGRIIVYHRNGDELLTFCPCCPRCYTILPENWFRAADFYPISLLAPSTGGKTTLMCSWMINNFEIFNRLEKMGDGYTVLAGFDRPSLKFKLQSYMEEEAKDLYSTGAYPAGTDRNRIPPLYMEIRNGQGEILLVGIYDCAGEMLKGVLEANANPVVTAFLSHMSAFVYLVEADRMAGIRSVKNGEEVFPVEETEWKILPLEEQGEKQAEAGSMSVSAEEMLENAHGVTPNPWEIYDAINALLIREGVKKKKHMAYSIIKSDELKGLPEVKEVPNSDILFREAGVNEKLNQDYILQANMIARDIFRTLVVEGDSEAEKERQTEALENGFHSVSWHCVCAAMKQKPGRTYRYKSIRRADPLIGCLLPKLEELGWQ